MGRTTGLRDRVRTVVRDRSDGRRWTSVERALPHVCLLSIALHTLAAPHAFAQTANSFWRTSLSDQAEEPDFAPAAIDAPDDAAEARPPARRPAGQPVERPGRFDLEPGTVGQADVPVPRPVADAPGQAASAAAAPRRDSVIDVIEEAGDAPETPETLARIRTRAGAPARAVQPRPTDPRPRRRATVNPFAAPGLRLGALRLSPSLGVFGGATTPDIGDTETFTEIEPELTLSTDWSRHQLEASLRTRARIDEDGGLLDTYDYDARLSARLDIGPSPLGTDTTVTLQFGATGREGDTLVTALPGALASNAPGARIADGLIGDVTPLGTRAEDEQERALTGSLDIAHALGRLDVGLTGEAERSDTSEREEATTYRLRARAGFEGAQVLPFIEASAARTTFCDTCDGDFDAIGGLAGLRLRDDHRLSGEIGLGYERRFDEAGADTENGLVWRGALAYELTPLVTLDLSTQASLGDVDVGSSRAVTFGATYLPRRWLTLTGGLAVTWEEFETLMDTESVSGTNRALTASLGAEYRINRFASIEADATQRHSTNGVTGTDTVESTVRVGVVLRR